MAIVQSLSNEVDALLAQYLSLLDEYMTLQESLSTSLTSINLGIARANFLAPRGIRYGQEFYGTRALLPARLCGVTGDPEMGTLKFAISTADAQRASVGSDGAESKAEAEVEDIKKLSELSLQSPSGAEDKEQTTDDDTDPKPTKEGAVPDPIRMFGFDVPTPLRNSQAESIRNLDVISKLASLSVNMQALEIHVRRTQKRRNKAVTSESLKASQGQLDPQTLLESGRREAIVTK